MSAFEEYVDQYGFHFSKKLYEWAVSMMRDRNGNKLQPMTKEQVAEHIRNHGVTLKNDKGWDAAYVLMMGKADYLGSSITDDVHLDLFVRDFLDDPDGNPTKAFDHFVVDCRVKKEPIFWEEMM
jgi:hypothetical protein